MDEGRTRLPALIGTIALHVAVVAWLASSPEQAARILDAVSMDVVDLTPEPEPPPEPVTPPEPEPEPERPPERPPEKQRPRARAEPEPEPEVEPEPEPARSAEPPPTIDFGEQSFASSGSGASFAMQASRGTSALGAYAPGRRGGSGTPGSAGTEPRPEARRDFAPVPGSQLARQPEVVGRGRPPYPEEARRQYVEGAVRLMVEVRANGRVRNVRVLSDPGSGLGAAAAAYVQQLQFRPALDRAGRPVDARIVYTVRYLLDD